MRTLLTRASIVLTAAVALAMASGCGRDADTPDLPTIPFDKYELANGLEVILSEDHRLPLVAVDVWYHVGPANEAEGRTGFAHLFEHMMFQGSKHVPGDSHFRFLEVAGATDVNGTTSFDRTNYFETLPANQLALGLWLESDRMGYLLDGVDELKLANQQDVVRNERRQSVENVPYGLAREALAHALYPPGHPYRANVIGSHADIQAAKLADVQAFFKQYYAPNNATIAIVGDFQPDEARALVEKYFGPLVRGPEVPEVTVETPPITSERRVEVHDRVQLPQVQMAWLTPPLFAPGDADADAVGAILGGGTSSRLYRSLVYEKQIAQSVDAFQSSKGLASTFEIIATARPGHTLEELETAIDEQLTALRRDGPTEAEVQRARDGFETTVLEGLERLGGFGGVADTLNLFNHYLGDPGYLPKYIEEHRALTPASVKAFAEQYLVPDARVVVEVTPGEPDPGPPVPTPPPPQVTPGTGAETINADAAWRNEPPPPSGTIDVSLPTPTSFTLANGLTVIQHVRPGLPVSAVSLQLRTGGDANPSDRPGLADFTAALLDQGTQTRSATELADAFAQLGTSLAASASQDSVSVSLEALDRNFGPAIDLLADVTLHPSFPEEEVERQRQSRLASLVETKQNPQSLASIEAYAALFGPDHAYGHIALGTEASVRATTRDDILGYWRANFVPANAALVVTGSIAEADLRPILERAFGAWSGGDAPVPDLGTAKRSDARVVIVDRPGSPQTRVLVAGVGAARTSPDYAATNVMNAILGGIASSRINMNLREAHGYTYGAFSQFVFRKHPGLFLVSTGVRTDVTAPAVREILSELNRIRDTPVTEEELADAKNVLVRMLPSAFETNARTVSTLGGLFVYGLGLDYYSTYPDAVRAVTVADVQAAAQRYLDPAALEIVAVGDRKAIEPGLRALGLGRIEVR